MGCSLRRVWACWLVPALLTREGRARLGLALLELALLELVLLELERLERAGLAPPSCASGCPEAPAVLFGHIRRLDRPGREVSTGAQFSFQEYTACREPAV
jgi:hypothetical protein